MNKNMSPDHYAMKYLTDPFEGDSADIEEKQNQVILDELDIRLEATDIVSLLENPKRLQEVIKKLKMKAFW